YSIHIMSNSVIFFLVTPSICTIFPLFPYTTLFRSSVLLLQKDLSILSEDLAYFRKLCDNYQLPEGACNSHTYLYQKLQELEDDRSEEHTSELQSRENLVCRLLLEKKNKYSLLKMQS